MWMQMLEILGNAATKDSSNIVLWIVLAAIALVLIVVCGVLSLLGKKSDQNDSDDKKKHQD